MATACASPTRAVRFGDRIRLLDDVPCQPQVYGNDLPARYLVVGRVEAESPVDRSGLVNLLSHSACDLGADGLIELQLGTYDTVRSQLDPATRKSTIEQGPKLHTATALAIRVLDATLVKGPAAPRCAPCPTCEPAPASPKPAVAPVVPAPAAVTPAVVAPAVEEPAVAEPVVVEPPVVEPAEEARPQRSEDDLPPPPPPVFDDL